jgi:hypothetical protein
MRKLALSFFLLFAATSFVYAQSNPVCPPDVLLAFARSGSACFSLERNQVCIGNGTVESQLFPVTGQTPAFAQPGDILDATLLHELHTQIIEKGISEATIYTQANLTDAEQHSAALLLFGDASIENQVMPLPELAGFAKGALNIRRAPENNADIITSLAVNKAVIANGRTQAGDWLRIHVPNSNDLGWVSADVVNPEGNLLNLTVLDVDTPVFRPFQLFKVTTGETSFCGGALPSGLLFQSPNAATVEVTINGASVQLSGAVSLQAGSALTINVLNGEATIAGLYVPAGAGAKIPLDEQGMAHGAPSAPEPYDLPALQALPINNLPYRTEIAPPLTADEIVQKTAEHEAVSVEATTEPVAAVDTTCKRLVRRDTTLWAGPGLFYEVVDDISAETPLIPVLQTADADGNTWWQLSSSSWIQADLVTQSGECQDIPVVVNAPPPEYNELSLETCESTNGPLRAGQEVEIYFIPPAFDNFGEARDALSIDPGRITIGSQTYYYIYASDPIRLGTNGERYIRRFYLYWTATPGTFRIVGDRLHYTPICTITVRVG